MRGNYSEADFRRQQTFSDGEVEMENPYMVQNNPGSAFSQSGESTAGPVLGWLAPSLSQVSPRLVLSWAGSDRMVCCTYA